MNFLDLCKNLCYCVADIVLMFKCVCVLERVLLCSLNGFSVRFGLVLLNERRFMGLCSYILEHILFDFEFSGCVYIVSKLCLILNFLALCLILNSMGLCLILNFFGLYFELFGEKKPRKFIFF